MFYLFNWACLATFLADFDLRGTLLHDSSVAVTFCVHDVDKAAVFVSSSDKLLSAISKIFVLLYYIIFCFAFIEITE